MKKALKKLARRFCAPVVHRLFFADLIHKTANFSSVKWLGHPIWQNILDLWIIQETIAEVKPELLIECGTNRGGSSLFYANLFDLMGKGFVVTIDVEKLHNLSHPRVTYLLGSSTSPAIVETVRNRVANCQGPVLVILDSEHSQKHVAGELEAYSPLVTPGSYCLVQDGVIDTFRDFRAGRPGPLPAILAFLKSSNDFEVDEERSTRFFISHHPHGWLRRKPSTKSD
jgi:cephalosporin hydroxylase